MTLATHRTALLLVATLALTATQAHAQERTGGNAAAKIAVVDVPRAFDALKEKAADEADLRAMAEQFNAEQEKRKKALSELRADLEILVKDSPAYQKTLAELERQAIELKVVITHQASRLERERATRTERLYRKLLTGIEAVAKRNALDLVLFKEPTPDFHDARPEQVAALIQVRKVLWHRDSLDMTLDVINYLNAEYQRSTTRP